MPMNRAKYPKNWKEFSHHIRFERAEALCECVGECGVKHEGPLGCAKEHLKVYDDVVCMLTTAHLNAKGGPCSCDPHCAKGDHVKAMCQGCHLRYDSERHQLNASNTRLRRAGQLPLPFKGDTDKS